MKLLNAALALAVLATATTVTVSAADAGPRRWHMVRTCSMVMQHHHRTRVCRMVRRGY
jgi:hypothetical protein